MHKRDIKNITCHQSNNFHKKQFNYLIENMQLCHLTDKIWNNLKAILIDHRDGCTDYHAEITAMSGPVVVRDVTRAPYWGPRGARCNLLLNPLR